MNNYTRMPLLELGTKKYVLTHTIIQLQQISVERYLKLFDQEALKNFDTKAIQLSQNTFYF